MALPTPPPEPGTTASWTRSLAGAIALALAMAAIGAASAYGVFEWRMRAQQAATSAQLNQLHEQNSEAIAALTARYEREQQALEANMKRLAEAATATGLLLSREGELAGLQTRLQEIDALRLELRATQNQLDAKLKALERSLLDQVAQQERQTAQALALDLRVKSLLIKAQGEVMLAQVHWAAGNRGLAKDELTLALRTLELAAGEAPESARPALRKAVESAEQTRTALILEQSTARDGLLLLWHQVGDLLAPGKP